jgi:hypothetical protein
MWPAAQHLTSPSYASCDASCDADALFVSVLQRSDAPSSAQIRHAIASAIGAFGCIGCAERVAQEFGDHPETAAARMLWARAEAGQAFRPAAAA